ncbi:hypothetical protein TNCV_451361 [Trichonephila clavipes]|nr:hypothetical protein TNCV_451361 [Trichonephila clavipes]
MFLSVTSNLLLEIFLQGILLTNEQKLSRGARDSKQKNILKLVGKESRGSRTRQHGYRCYQNSRKLVANLVSNYDANLALFPRSRQVPIESPLQPEWSVRKTSIAWSTLDAEPQTSPARMVRCKKDVGGRIELSCLYCRVTHLPATPRWSDSSLKIPWKEDAEQLLYAPHWSCTGYYCMR